MKQIVRILTDDNFCSGKNSDLSLGRNNAHRADSVSYTQELLSLQKQGLSYPAARAQALSKLLSDYDAETILAFLNAPNNILAIEYEKSIAQWNASHPNPIHGYGIRRIGGGYHDATIHNTYSSATAIRNLLLASPHEDTRAPLRAQVPSYVYDQLTQAAAQGELRACGHIAKPVIHNLRTVARNFPIRLSINWINLFRLRTLHLFSKHVR